MYPLSVGVVAETKQIWDELTRCLADLPVRILFELTEVPSDWAAFTDRIERVRPDVVLLDVSHLREPIEDVVRQIKSASMHPAVFALHSVAEPDSILAAFRAGVSEYLYPPFEASLRGALERLGQKREEAQTKRATAGKMVGFVSVKGGCGATTLACHVAVHLPEKINAKVLLADLDMQAGLIAFLVKAKSPYSVADAVNNIQRLDQSYWRALISNGIPNLEIITAPATPAAKQITGPQLKQVLSFVRTQYDWTVLDLGRNITPQMLSLLDLVQELYVVTTHEVPALHQAKQMIQYLVNSGYPQANLRLILNRTPKRMDVTIEELESMLGIPIFATVPNDYQALQEAFIEGRLLEGNSSLGRSLEALTSRIAGVQDAKKKKFSLFG